MMSYVNLVFIKVITEINHQSYVESYVENELDKIKNILPKF